MKNFQVLIGTGVVLWGGLTQMLAGPGTSQAIQARVGSAPVGREEKSSIPVPPKLVEPADFHVDAARGDDNNDGSAGRPFRTIQKAVDSMKAPGSVCTIRAGVYRETIHFRQSGTPDKPLRLQAEPGAVLSGAESVTSWQASDQDADSARPGAANLYYAVVGPNPLRNGGQMAVFVETRIVPEARWPNDHGSYPWPSYAFCTAAGYEKDGKNGWIADTNLPDRPDNYWKGCRLIVLAGHGWRGRDLPIVHYVSAEKKIITNFENNLPGAPGNATLRGPVPRKQPGQEPFKGNEYFLVADPAELANPGLWIQNECDAPNEWAYHFDKTNPEKSRLYFKTAGAPPSNVELRVRDVGLDFGDARHVQVTGLRLLGCRPVFGANSKGVVLQGLQMTYVDHQRTPGGEGIFIDGDEHTIRDCAIEWSAGNLVTFRSGRGHRFINNLAQGANYSTERGGVLLWRGAKDVLVSHCTLKDSGAMILAMHDAEGAIVEYCEIADGAKLCTDLGLKYDNYIGTYCLRYNLWHGANSAEHTGHGSSAIYLEDGGAQAIVHHNIVWDVDFGFQLNSSSTLHRMFNNTVGPCRQAAVLCGSNRQKMAVERFTSIMANSILSGTPLRVGNIGIRGLVLRANLMGGDAGFVDPARGDFRLRADSPARDKATLVAGITQRVADGKLDIGALEYGEPDWTQKVGHDFANPPDAVYDYPEPEYRAYTDNYSFEASAEKGGTPASWILTGTAKRVTGASHDRANPKNDITARNGRFTIQISGGPGEVRQTVRGLKPRTEYILAAGVRPGQENQALYLGVENQGGKRKSKEIVMPLPAEFLKVQFGGGHWTLGALRFTTGPTNTTAEIFVGANAVGPEPVFIDTVMVVPAEPWHNPPHPPVALEPGMARDAVRKGGGGTQYTFSVAAMDLAQDAGALGGLGKNQQEIQLRGNSCKVIPLDYLFSPFTVIEFEFKSTGPAAAQGIGIGADDSMHRAAVFLARASAAADTLSTTGSLWKPLRTDSEGWEHYRIPVGQYLRYLKDYGVKPCVVFIHENLKGQKAECRFRKVRICEEP